MLYSATAPMWGASDYLGDDENEVDREKEFNKFLPVFQNYQKARLSFAQGVAELLSDTDRIPDIVKAGAVPMLCQLIFDEVRTVRNTALFVIGKLADTNKEAAADIVRRNMLPFIVEKLRIDSRKPAFSSSHTGKSFRRLVVYILKAISKHNYELAKQLIEARSLGMLKICLADKDPQIREYASWSIANISKHSRDLANSVVFDETGLMEALVAGLSDTETPVVRATVSAIYEIVKHSEQLVKELAELDVVALLTELLSEEDEELKQIILPALTEFRRQSESTGEEMTSREILSFSVEGLASNDPTFSKNAAIHLLEIVKDSEEMAMKTARAGTLESMVKFMEKAEKANLLPAVTFVSNVAAISEDTAKLIIETKGLLSNLSFLLSSDAPVEIREECAVAIGNLGNHCQKLANEIGEAKLVVQLSSLSEDPETPAELQKKFKESLKGILEKCVHFPTLEALISSSSADILDIVLSQLTKILHGDEDARKEFVANGTLKKLLEIKPEAGSIAERAINVIRMCFPPEIIKMNSPSFMEEMLLRVQQYKPGRKRRSPLQQTKKGPRSKNPTPVPEGSETSESSKS